LYNYVVILPGQTFSSAAAAEKLLHKPCRIIVVGATLAGRLKSGADTRSGIKLLVASPNIESCLSDRPHQPAGVLVIEIPTVHADTTRQIFAWLDDIGAQKALVVYRFAATDVLQQLPDARVQTVRAPVSPVVVRNLRLGMRPLAGTEKTGGGQVGVNRLNIQHKVIGPGCILPWEHFSRDEMAALRNKPHAARQASLTRPRGVYCSHREPAVAWRIDPSQERLVPGAELAAFLGPGYSRNSSLHLRSRLLVLAW
jgi:hypothetical protein